MTKRKLFRGRYETMMGYESQSQVKEDSSDSPNTNYLGTRRLAGEDIKSGQMPVQSDNHPDNYTQEKFSSHKPCRTPPSLDDPEDLTSTHSPPDLSIQVLKFHEKFPNWEEQAREMIG